MWFMIKILLTMAQISRRRELFKWTHDELAHLAQVIVRFADDAMSSPVIHRRGKNTLDELSMRILRREEILYSGEESRAEALGFRLDFAFTLTSHDIIIVAVFFPPYTFTVEHYVSRREAQGEN